MSKTQAAEAATYRVPTRDEMNCLVDEITEHILAGRRVRHWKHDIGQMITGIHLQLYADCFSIHFNDGRYDLRSAETIERDTFELCGPLVVGRSVLDSINIVPAWLERRSE